MRDRISLCIRVFLTLAHILFVKILNIRTFKSPLTEDFALSVKIKISDKGKISFGRHLHARRNVIFEADGGNIKIDDGCFLNNGCMIVSRESISIGEGTSFGPNVLVYDHDHDTESALLHEENYKTAPIVIGKNVWIGANTVILRGARIGDGCVVGAGSVIKGDYEDNSIIIQKRQDSVQTKSGRKEVHEFAG